MKIKITLLLLVVCAQLTAQNGIALKQVIDQLLARRESRVDSAKTTGFVIGCLDGDSTWLFPYGRLSKTTRDVPTGDTYFEIGGLSQVFIADKIHELVAQKQLDYAMPVNRYLAESFQFPMGERITVLQLVTHTSGLPKLPNDIGTFETDKEQPFEAYTEGGLFDFLKTLDATQLTENKYRYAPLNYAILEKMLERKGLLNFEEDTFSSKVHAQGYNLAQKPVEMWHFEETFRWTLGRHTTARLLLDFVRQQMDYQDLYAPLYPTNIVKNTFMSKAWLVDKESKRPTIYFATGATGGHSAFVAFVPETRTGVVVLTNARLIAGKLGLEVLRVLNENWKRKRAK
jgi:serine-type D-Ala-D-Ala carboxypeptidase/endopeptidase